MTWHESLNPLFWILLLSFLFQFFTTKLPFLKLPTVITYIVFGMMIRNTNLLVVTPTDLHWMKGIGQFGLFYLMFLSGLEVDPSLFQLPHHRKKTKEANHPLKIGFLIFISTSALSYLIALLIQHLDSQVHAWMMMMILSTTSLGIILPVLKELQIVRSSYGQTLLSAAFLADLLTMFAISLASDIYQNGLHTHQFIIGLLLPFLIAVYFMIQQIRRTAIWNHYFKHNQATKIKATLALLGLFGIITDFLGAEALLGSFLAGILFSSFRLREDNRLRMQLELIGDSFLIPIFFIMVGVNFHIQTFFHDSKALAWIPFLLLSAYTVKFLPMLWFGRHFGFRKVTAGGVLLSARLTLVIVACTIGTQLGILSSTIYQAMVVVAILTSTLSPIVFMMFSRRQIE